MRKKRRYARKFAFTTWVVAIALPIYLVLDAYGDSYTTVLDTLFEVTWRLLVLAVSGDIGAALTLAPAAVAVWAFLKLPGQLGLSLRVARRVLP